MALKQFAIAGAEFPGAVLARELALHTVCKIVVFDERDHMAGNCHTARNGVIAEALDFAVHFLKSYTSKGNTLPRFMPAFAEQIRQHRV
jgi:UDP-galactopyranose mutase